MALLARENTPAICLCAGAMHHAMNRAAADLGVRERMRWLGPTDDAASIFAAADVTVHPTWYDPSSKVVIESLMMGVPAITTRFNGAADVMTNGHDTVAGRILDDPADAAALAAAMRDLADPKARKACKLDRDALADRLSMKRHVDALEKVLEDVPRKAT
jgi:UDP-glucose:(heptosyl)LPS alpha-1,3-glucosyltransferase